MELFTKNTMTWFGSLGATNAKIYCKDNSQIVKSQTSTLDSCFLMVGDNKKKTGKILRSKNNKADVRCACV